MIDRKLLLADLTHVVDELERDLRERTESVAEVGAKLRAEHQAARQRDRTAEPYEVWRDARITQVAVAWVLSCVFVRFLEDNGLLVQPYLSGPGERLALARDHYTLYFRAHPRAEDPQYLQDVFRDVAKSPAMKALLDDQHNPLWSLTPSADGAKQLVEFWQKKVSATGAPIHDFTDPAWNTRFLGDLYEELSEAAQKRYALRQTPDFVLSFILDRTLTPAIDEFGYREVRVIDPTCGSGHFLLEAFRRLFARHQHDEPGTNARVLAQRALDQVFGVDLNPYAIAIARFRLIVEALRVADVRGLAQAPDFKTHVAVGDSLLHGPRPRRIEGRQLLAWTEEDKLAHVYDTEDADELRRILGQSYHVVVGNPPYIVPQDLALAAAYRSRYESCYRQYSLGVPFTERFFDLARAGADGSATGAGYVGMITADSFMKREFGKQLIERVLPLLDLTHLINPIGPYIPGHGTGIVILFARHRRPVSDRVRAVRGIRGEPSTPSDPARGLVWSAIVDQVDRPGSISAFVSVDDIERKSLATHPWRLGGGGAAELTERIERAACSVLEDDAAEIGRTIVLGEDEIWTLNRKCAVRMRVADATVDFCAGGNVRDWALHDLPVIVYPYSGIGGEALPPTHFVVTHYLWRFRTLLVARTVFGRTLAEQGRAWYEPLEHYREKLRGGLTLTYGEIKTHNHFALDRGGKVFNRTAPVVRLRSGATEDDYVWLLGLLNSSTACFWLRQMCPPKGGAGIGRGIASEPWEQRHVFDATKVGCFPVPARRPIRQPRILRDESESGGPLHDLPNGSDLRAYLDERRVGQIEARGRMIALQEDLDWECYHLYGLLDQVIALPPDRTPIVRVGERAFEIVMARKMAAGKLSTRWFECHGCIVITEIPSHWPEEYRAVVRRRIEVIDLNPDIALIEQPEYKRRWNTEPWDDQVKHALREWLLDRLEDGRYWIEAQITTCARLADRLDRDAEFRRVAELYRGRADFDLTELVVELVEAESVPFLAALRYSESGARKRLVWERTWELQRREDAGETVAIDVPPEYTFGQKKGERDFCDQRYWRLRGKLDVPKERFILYPLAGTDADPTPVIGWAGWDHLQQARVLAETIVARRDKEAWGSERIAPLLAGIAELLPWVRQWHNDPDPATGERAGDVFAQFLEEQARSLGLAPEDLSKWAAPAGAGHKPRGRKKKA